MATRTEWRPGTREVLVPGLFKALPVLLLLLLSAPRIFAGGATGFNPTPVPAASQWEGEGSSERDFFFSEPKAFAGARLGRFFPRARGDLFGFITDELTLDKNDFRTWSFGLDGGFPVHERAEMILSVEVLNRTKISEFRDFVDQQGGPITQQTYYAQVPLTGGVKFLLLPRGRRIGRYAWVPSKLVPFVSAGAGAIWYRFEQSGDFVDHDTLNIFAADLESSGWTATGYLGGGIDILLAKNLSLTLDLRYSWAEPELDSDFVRFDPLDMSGFRPTAGLHWRF